jgi:hypothetical protein
MAYLHVVHEILGLLERHVQSADAVARIATHAREAPFGQTLPYELRDIL